MIIAETLAEPAARRKARDSVPTIEGSVPALSTSNGLSPADVDNGEGAADSARLLDRCAVKLLAKKAGPPKPRCQAPYYLPQNLNL